MKRVSFAEYVSRALATVTTVQDIAAEFAVAQSTVKRWAEGTAEPHHKIAELVIEWLVKEGLKMVDLARIGYEAYAKSTGGKTYDGRDMPKYEDLPDNIKAAWEAAAHAVRSA